MSVLKNEVIGVAIVGAAIFTSAPAITKISDMLGYTTTQMVRTSNAEYKVHVSDNGIRAELLQNLWTMPLVPIGSYGEGIPVPEMKVPVLSPKLLIGSKEGDLEAHVTMYVRFGALRKTGEAISPYARAEFKQIVSQVYK